MDEVSATGAEGAATDSSTLRGGAGAGVPRWVKVFLAVGLGLLVVVLLAVALGIGGEHGPGRHQGLSSLSGPAAWASCAATGCAG
jgi:hypothetical protein